MWLWMEFVGDTIGHVPMYLTIIHDCCVCPRMGYTYTMAIWMGKLLIWWSASWFRGTLFLWNWCIRSMGRLTAAAFDRLVCGIPWLVQLCRWTQTAVILGEISWDWAVVESLINTNWWRIDTFRAYQIMDSTDSTDSSNKMGMGTSPFEVTGQRLKWALGQSHIIPMRWTAAKVYHSMGQRG